MGFLGIAYILVKRWYEERVVIIGRQQSRRGKVLNLPAHKREVREKIRLPPQTIKLSPETEQAISDLASRELSA